MKDHPPPPDLDTLAAEVFGRIRPVCAHFPEEEVRALARRMAAVEIKFWDRADVTHTHRRFREHQAERDAERRAERHAERHTPPPDSRSPS